VLKTQICVTRPQCINNFYLKAVFEFKPFSPKSGGGRAFCLLYMDSAMSNLHTSILRFPGRGKKVLFAVCCNLLFEHITTG